MPILQYSIGGDTRECIDSQVFLAAICKRLSEVKTDALMVAFRESHIAIENLSQVSRVDELRIKILIKRNFCQIGFTYIYLCGNRDFRREFAFEHQGIDFTFKHIEFFGGIEGEGGIGSGRKINRISGQ